MTRLLGTVAVVAMLAVGGCAALQSSAPQVAATVSESILPAGDLTLIQDACGLSGGLLASWSKSSNAILSTTAIDGAAYCQQFAAAPAGQVPSTTTSTTLSWLNGLIAAAKIAATVAGLL